MERSVGRSDQAPGDRTDLVRSRCVSGRGEHLGNKIRSRRAVGVEQQDPRCRSLRQPAVDRSGKAGVGALANQAKTGFCARFDKLRRAVRRGVVHHHDLGRRRLEGRHRIETRGQGFDVVVGDHDDRVA